MAVFRWERARAAVGSLGDGSLAESSAEQHCSLLGERSCQARTRSLRCFSGQEERVQAWLGECSGKKHPLLARALGGQEGDAQVELLYWDGGRGCAGMG